MRRPSLSQNLLPNTIVEKEDLSRSIGLTLVASSVKRLYVEYRNQQLFEVISLDNDKTVENALIHGERYLQVLLLLLFKQHFRAHEPVGEFFTICESSLKFYFNATQAMDQLIKIEEQENNMAAIFSWIKLVCFFILILLPYTWRWLSQQFTSSSKKLELIYDLDFVTGSFVVQLISCPALLRTLKFCNIFAWL